MRPFLLNANLLQEIRVKLIMCIIIEEDEEEITWTTLLGQFAAGQVNKEKLSLWGKVF